MDSLWLWLGFAAVLVLALGFVRLGVRGALAPLCAVAGVSLWLSLFGALGFLRLGGILLYVPAGVCVVFLAAEKFVRAARPASESFVRANCVRPQDNTMQDDTVQESEPGNGGRTQFAPTGWRTGIARPTRRDAEGGVPYTSFHLARLGFGFWFFAIGSLFFILLMWIKQPLLTGWDEFSLWGTAQKLMQQSGQLYTTAPVGWARLYTESLGEIGWIQTQKPAYMVFGVFFQLFGTRFAPWQAYAGGAIFQLSLLAALFVPFQRRFKKHWNAILPLALVAVLLPFVFLHYQQARGVSAAWLTTLGDIPLGLCFGAVFACRYGARGRRGLASLLPGLLALALLSMIKDTGFALALVAAVALAVDVWLCNKGRIRFRAGQGSINAGHAKPVAAVRRGRRTLQGGFASQTGRIKASFAQNRWLCGGAQLAAGLFAVLAPFIAWERYISTLTGASRMDSAVTTGGPGMLQFPGLFVRDLLSPEKSERFQQVTSGMVQQFLQSRGNMLGTGLFTAAVCLGLVLLAALLYKSPLFRRRCVAFGVLSSLGFAAYYLLLTTMYLYLFRPEQAAILDNIDRYVYPYYIGWLMGSLSLLGLAIARGRGRCRLLAKAAVLGFAALLLLRTWQLVPAQYTLFGVHADEFGPQRAFAEKAEALKTRLDPGGRVFLVKSGDNGIGWFMYCYGMLPYQMDYSFGGTMELRIPGPNGVVTPRALRAEEWQKYLAETGCTVVYIDFADYDFIQTYGHLFSDGMAAYQNGETDLYAVVPQGDGVILEPYEVV